MNVFYKALLYFQKHGYYVCQRIADRLGIRAKVVRTSFMYLTFVTLGFGFALKIYYTLNEAQYSIYNLWQIP